MSSIDDLFKKPALPSNKRKLSASRDPNEIYKAAKLASNGHAKSDARSAPIEDTDDTPAGPSALPAEDWTPDIPDDDEGRFFGGGITKDESRILDYMDEQEEVDIVAEKIDLAWLRKIALNFERKISKNSELRAKFEGDPQKFMGSEADLDADIKALSILTEHSELYEEFAKLGCVTSLVNLLAHENTDISIDAVEIINELTDENVEAEEAQWNALVDAMLNADLLGLIVSNFTRLDENNESDRSGVYHALSVLENLASRIPLAEKIGQDTSILNWLLQRIQKRESPVGQNKQYAAEILAILTQSSLSNRRILCQIEGVDPILQILAAYRKRDPVKGTEEEEFIENLFNCITCLVDEAEGKEKFVEAEGVELCLIMLREGKMSKSRALRLLDHALSGTSGTRVCQKLIEAAGLKVIFGMLMKKLDAATAEHLLGIFSSLLKLLPANSAERIRTLAKFVEKDYEKLEKLVKLRWGYATRVEIVEKEIRIESETMDLEEKEEMADEWLEKRLDAGLFCLQTADVILAWLVAEDDGADKKIRSLLAEHDETLAVVRASMQEQLDTIVLDSEDAITTREMLNTLLQFVT